MSSDILSSDLFPSGSLDLILDPLHRALDRRTATAPPASLRQHRREHARVPVRVPIRYRVLQGNHPIFDQRKTAETLDLSLGGLRVVLEEQSPFGGASRDLTFEIEFPHLQGLAPLRARPVWFENASQTQSAIGLQFSELSAPYALEIAKLMNPTVALAQNTRPQGYIYVIAFIALGALYALQSSHHRDDLKTLERALEQLQLKPRTTAPQAPHTGPPLHTAP